ncbi:WD40/YVTN/BNR-like repeat-containing protein [Solimicrobium silvestre]|uniref:Photosynthesis system II assembly factor Ycf48/Hcf136-like domain-containing protein n=1 Tax=Solimicrobium silvestre TaxID=2099400 RepID=A0A2S9GTW6_9BURK|nr:YCF48-related protein [Solimicrobium silvestre]PRC91149.1 hypothetical protein S2091_4150 [Solimicrobium silvestre]
MNAIMRRQSRAVLLAVGMLLAVESVSAAHAAPDPLEHPAATSDRAARAMLLSVTTAGKRLVAVGEHGVIVYSDTQGKNWVQAKVPVSVSLTVVFFSDAKNGWAVGHDGVVLRSQDAGQHWEKRFDGNQANALMLAEAEKKLTSIRGELESKPGDADKATSPALEAAQNTLADIQAGAKFGPSRPLLGVWFKNADEGYVVGAYGQFFHTLDGGLHWESLANRINNPDGLHYNAISATPSGALLISGEGGKIYRSENQGESWQTLDSGYKGQLYGALGITHAGSEEQLLAFGFGGHILLSNADKPAGGWQELAIITNKNLIGGSQTSDGSVWLVAQDGSVLRSNEHAQHFTIVQQGTGLLIAGSAVLKEEAGYAEVAVAGMGGVHLISIDSGINMSGKLK